MKIFVITKKMLIIAAAVIFVAAAAVIIALSFSDGAVSPTSAMAQLEEYELEVLAGKKKELPVYSVERSDMKIAITVDAAWEDDKTQFILDTFDEYGVKATFFLCGYWTDKYPDDVKMIAERGHEIGNHSATHPHMNSISKEQMRKETVEYDDKIEKLAGKRCKVFRAPFGEYNDTVITTMRSLGYEVIQWDIDTMDTIWDIVFIKAPYQIIHKSLTVRRAGIPMPLVHFFYMRQNTVYIYFIIYTLIQRISINKRACSFHVHSYLLSIIDCHSKVIHRENAYTIRISSM